MEYEVGGSRRRAFGLGMLSGGVLLDDNMMEKVQENINFRIQSARKMVTGQTDQRGTQPIERRMVLRERRLDLFNMGSDSSESGVERVDSTSSGRIGDSQSTNRSSASKNVQSGTPSMSEVDRGTKQRASERGFGR